MKIQLHDGRQVEVEFIHSSGDPRIEDLLEQRLSRDAANATKSIDSTIGTLKKYANPKTVCKVTVIRGEIVESTAEGVAKAHRKGKDYNFHQRRIIALDQALQTIWPVRQPYIEGGKVVAFDRLPENRPQRKEVWSAMIAKGFRPIKESTVTKLRRQFKMTQPERRRPYVKSVKKFIEGKMVFDPNPVTSADLENPAVEGRSYCQKTSLCTLISGHSGACDDMPF